MSREIKFRVWDEISKTMTYPEGGLYCITMIGCVCDDETDSGGILENRDYRCEAMQSTGLQDKNGKDIYEGDVYKTEYYTGTPGKFKRIIGFIEYRGPDYRVMGVKQYEGLCKELSGWGEVIGNIHENPDLI